MSITQKEKDLIYTYHKTRGFNNPSLLLPDLLSVYVASTEKSKKEYRQEMKSYLRLFERGQLKAGQPIREARLTPADET